MWQPSAYKMMCRKRYTFGDGEKGGDFPLIFCRKRLQKAVATSQKGKHTFCDTNLAVRSVDEWQQRSLAMSG